MTAVQLLASTRFLLTAIVLSGSGDRLDAKPAEQRSHDGDGADHSEERDVGFYAVLHHQPEAIPESHTQPAETGRETS
jgi:hypothetical protein